MSRAGREPGREFGRLDARTLWGFWLFRLREHLLRRQSDGALYPAYVLECSDWVNVVATTEDDQLVLVRQFRFGTWTQELEVPGGILERGEDPAAAGLRELAEETGYACAKLVPLGTVRPNPAVQNNRLHVFWAPDCKPAGPQQLDEFENIEVVLMSQERAYRELGAGIGHAAAVASLALFFRRLGPPTATGAPAAAAPLPPGGAG